MEDSTYFQPISALQEDRKAAFVSRTYGHVALAVLAFIGVETLMLESELITNFMLSLMSGWTWLLLLVAFGFVTNYTEKMAYQATEKSTQYLAMGIFVVAEALIFVPLLHIALYYSNGGPDTITQAAIITLALFAGLSAVALFTKRDFSFLKTILTVGFFIAVGLIVAGMLFGFNLGLWFSVGMVALAAGSILYQTSNLFHRYHEQQHVAAALGLFASLMLLFWYILSILNRN
ncbi:MAG: Bax inhibitor-1/YccA family protein [Flavobacteriales bacterium]